MATPRISVLMPVYNGQQFLAAAIESMLAQTCTDFEFIILNDGSTDDTPAILSRYAAQDGRIQVVTLPENIGYTRALNRGLDMAHGEYLARQDADDISLPTRLAAEASLLDTQPRLGLVGIIPTVIDADSTVLRRERRFGTSNVVLQQQLLKDCCFCHGSVMMRRLLVETVGRYEAQLEPAEDYDLWLRLSEVAEIANVDAPLYQFRQHINSVSQKRRAEQLQQAALALERAAFRRGGPQPPNGSFVPAANYFLRAAIAWHMASDVALAQHNLGRACALWPSIFNQAEPLLALLADRTAGLSVEEALAVSQSVFEGLLPKLARLARLRRRFEAQLNMQEVFGSWSQREVQYVRPYLWAGITADPHWLLNRGVLRYLIHAVFHTQ